MVAEFGADTVERYMRHVQDNAEECVRRVITALKDGAYTLPLDNGARIRVAVRVDAERRSARIDFTGTSAQLRDNFNAPRAITVAAVLYVFRTLVNDEIPLNAGCLKPLEIVVPDLGHYRRFLVDKLLDLPIVREVRSNIAIQTLKAGAPLPLGHLDPRRG